MRHGLSGTKVYKAWADAKDRCRAPDPLYGGRGIRCLYKSIEEFVADVGFPPTPEHSLERKDPDGNYEPGNVIWLPMRKQVRNRRITPKYLYRGKEYALGELSEMGAEVEYHTLFKRIEKLGWPVEKAVDTPTGRWSRQGPHSVASKKRSRA